MWASPQHDYAQIKRHEGTRKYAEEHGLKFTNFITPRHEDILEALNKIEDYSLDGVILYPYADVRYKVVLQKLIDKKFPVVLSRSCHSLPLSTVMSNDGVGEYQATHYLIDKYHRPAYYLTASAESPQDAPERYEGYKDAMRDAGFGNLIEKYTCIGEVLENDPIYYGKEKHYRPGFAAVGRAVDRIECPASVLSENDSNVPDIYDNAARKGLVIGKDLMVVGFDDLPLAKLLKPSLTTVHAHIEELGYEAGKLLHRLIKQEVQPPVHIHLPLKLIIRESA
jgi:DNA-binding LacI/PurR family transcriptional regulator